MRLKEIYKPIQAELARVEHILEKSLQNTRYKSILRLNRYLLERKGKRLRPALLLFCAKASQNGRPADYGLAVKIAAAMELIHMASLVHDDVIDHASSRHNKPTINYKWDNEVSITLGDYLFSEAFRLIAGCGRSDVLECVSSATKALCEGELIQVCQRDNLELSREKYLIIVKKKTAGLFAASCQAGGLLSGGQKSLQKAFKGYGLNFGIAFQITDDYRDLIADKKTMGKLPGQDIKMGEMTLPLLRLWERSSARQRKQLKELIASRDIGYSLPKIRQRVFDAGIAMETKQQVRLFVNSAKERISIIPNSPYKKSLINLADFITERWITR